MRLELIFCMPKTYIRCSDNHSVIHGGFLACNSSPKEYQTGSLKSRRKHTNNPKGRKRRNVFKENVGQLNVTQEITAHKTVPLEFPSCWIIDAGTIEFSLTIFPSTFHGLFFPNLIVFTSIGTKNNGV